MGQQKAKEAVIRHLLRAGCGARPTDGQVQEEDGAWAPSEGWWSEKQEIAMCHEVIGVLMSLESDEDKNDGEQREWVDKSYMM